MFRKIINIQKLTCRNFNLFNIKESILCLRFSTTTNLNLANQIIKSNFRGNVMVQTAGNLNLFHTSSVDLARVREKSSFSSLKKHLKPDGLTGNERRRKMVKDGKKSRFINKPVSKSTRGFVPARFKLQTIDSDAKFKPQKLTYETISAMQKFRDREKKRNANNKVKIIGSAEPTSTTKFDMADMNIVDNVQGDENITNFQNFDLKPEVLEALYKLFPTKGENLEPTKIQTLALSQLSKPEIKYALLAAETGSGKTLAYLLLIINKMKQQEEGTSHTFVEYNKGKSKNRDFGDDSLDPFKNGTVPEISRTTTDSSSKLETVLNSYESQLLTTTSLRRLNRPRAIVLVPSCTLAEQVHAVAKKLSHVAKFRALCITRNTVRKDLLRRLQQPVDLIVTTPAGLIRHVKDNTISLSNCQYLTIDEADTMFEKGFGEDVKYITDTLQSITKKSKLEHQIVIVSATLPKQVLQLLETRFQGIVKLTTSTLHKAVAKCKQHFVDLDHYKGNRQLALLDVLRQFEQRTTATTKSKISDRILIFCNTRLMVGQVHNFLKEKGISALPLYGGDSLTNADVSATMEQVQKFLYPPNLQHTHDNYNFHLDNRESILDNSKSEFKVDPKNPLKILVSTDLASRGLDTYAVNHVILFNFPTSIVDYIHRTGRTARAGRAGTVTCLVGKKDRRLADRIKRSVRTNNVLG